MKHLLWALFLVGVCLGRHGEALAQTAIAPTKGDGLTTATAYQITSLGNLVWLSNQTLVTATTGRYYKLMNDIDASETAKWGAEGGGEADGFPPIGQTYQNPFDGIFDGAGHIITDIFNHYRSGFVGLFGTIGTHGVVKKLGIVGGTVRGGNAMNDVVGGLVGRNDGTIQDCYTSCYVSALWSSGGLASINAGLISRCYTIGTVTGYLFKGSLVEGNDGTVSECYSTGSVIITPYAADMGGLVGVNNSNVLNSYWDVQSSGNSTAGGGTGRTTAQMMQQSSYEKWNFSTDWGIQGAYPYLRSMPTRKLTYIAGTHGKLSNGTTKLASLTQTVNLGTNGVAVTAVPDANYKFTRWSDGRTDNPRLDARVMANLSLTASFEISNTVQEWRGYR